MTDREKRHKIGWLNKSIREKEKYLKDMEFYLEELLISSRTDYNEVLYVQGEIDKSKLDIIELEKQLENTRVERSKSPFVVVGDTYVDGIGANPINGDRKWANRPVKLHKPIYGRLI